MNFKVFENKKLQKEIKELKERQNQIDEEIETKSKKYERGKATKTKRIQNKKLKAKLEHSEDLFHEAAINSAKMELFVQKTPGYIEAEKEDEETYKTKQKEIAEQIEIGSRHKNFKLELPKLGPYRIKYDRTGRYLLMGSKLGHVALLDWYRSSKKCELQAQEAVRDVVFLQNEAMFAVAQKKYTYVYDSNGVEIHCLRNHQDVNRLEYLPYHFLLTSIGNSGYLKYQDVSTGTVVAEIPTKLGPCYAMKQNKHNAIIHLGHSNGTVSLCSPNLHKPVAKIFVNRGRVEDLAIDDTGRYMATSGTDNSIKIWDLRKFHYLYSFKKINSPALSLDISQTNLLAAGFSNKVLIWKDWINEAEKEKMEIVNENSNEISNEIMNEILNENTNQNLNQNLNQNQNQNLNQNQNQNLKSKSKSKSKSKPKKFYIPFNSFISFPQL
ncbi:wd-repeat protein bing4 [Anaeramoeba ignava]|uniref:Wd-repeat protein bing4 n=1 Tax=Anaeramoeba ignava TaxID=1746090 RepID=A0A9Q0RDJ4_ANAIG|nr:wd-repeat protein bing4 [Anaeramoeba ignava]